MPAALAEGDGWISSWWLAGGLAVVGLLALCWGVMRRRRRRRAWPVVVLTVVAFLAAVLVGLNAYTGYVPNWSAAKLLLTGQWAGERGGHVTTVQIPVAYGETARGGDFSETSGLADQLRARGQTAVLHEVEGEGHTWPMAGQALPYGLEFVSSHMP